MSFMIRTIYVERIFSWYCLLNENDKFELAFISSRNAGSWHTGPFTMLKKVNKIGGRSSTLAQLDPFRPKDGRLVFSNNEEDQNLSRSPAPFSLHIPQTLRARSLMFVKL